MTELHELTPVPLDPSEAIAPVAPAAAGDRAELVPGAPGLETVKILLVDDRAEDLKILASVVEQPGYELHLATSGAQALKRVLTHDFGVIVLDVVMPDLDGFETARLLKRRERSRLTPLIFLTANGLEMSHIFRAYEAGAVDYLEKPFTPEVVRAKVAVFAELDRKEQRLRRQAQELAEVERRQRTFEVARIRQQSEVRYRALAETVPAVVLRLKATGELEYVNRRWTETTGVAASASLGWRWLEAIHSDDRAAFEAAWREASRLGQGLRAEVRIRSRQRRGQGDGSRWHICQIVPEKDLTGEAVGFIGTLVDCDELRRRVSPDQPVLIERQADASDWMTSSSP